MHRQFNVKVGFILGYWQSPVFNFLTPKLLCHMLCPRIIGEASGEEVLYLQLSGGVELSCNLLTTRHSQGGVE